MIKISQSQIATESSVFLVGERNAHTYLNVVDYDNICVKADQEITGNCRVGKRGKIGTVASIQGTYILPQRLFSKKKVRQVHKNFIKLTQATGLIL